MRVFITGASSGIGAALARRYAASGATLGLVARRSEALEALVAALPSPPAGAHRIYPLDVTDTARLRAAAEDFIAEGVPEVVVANAGISIGILTEYAEDVPVFKRIVETNLVATLATFQPFVRPMKDLALARLVGIASVAGVRGLPGSGAYSASKAAVIAYCESLRVELRNTPIRVVTIVPGFIATPMTERNPYGMPFLMPVDDFAERVVKAIETGKSYAVIPWQMGMVAKLLRLCPNALYDRVFSKAKHKPRQL